MEAKRVYQPHWQKALRLAVLCLLLIGSGAGRADAQSPMLNRSFGTPQQISFRVTGLYSHSLRNGMYPVLVEVENKTQEKFSATLNFESSEGNYNYRTIVTSSFRVTTEPQSKSTHSLLIPLSAARESHHHYRGNDRLDLNVQFSNGERDYNSMNGGMDESYPSIAMGNDAFQKLRREFAGKLKRRLSRAHGGSGNHITEFDPAHIPGDWRAFSGVDAMVFNETDWNNVSQAARSALFDWVRLGGTAVLYPDSSERTAAELGIPDLDGQWGAGAFVLGSPPSSSGKVDVSPLNVLPPLYSTRTERFFKDYGQTRTNWSPANGLGKRRFAHAQVLLILLAFGILVGPVNLFVWAKPGKRHRLFFTTPLISIGASLLLAGLIVVQDGFGGKGIRNTLVYADPQTNKAYIIQEQASRTGVLFKSSFETNPRAVVVPLSWGGAAASSSDESPKQFQLNGNKLSGDWFRSRSDQSQYLEAVVSSRARLELQGGDGPPKLTSSFGHPLEKLFYLSADGSFWQTSNLGSGATATMESITSAEFHNAWNPSAGQFSKTLAGYIESLDKGAAAKAPDGYFFATAADIGDLSIETLSSVRWKTQTNLITGPVVRAGN